MVSYIPNPAVTEPPRAIDVEGDLLLWVLGLPVKELANDQVGAGVVNLGSHEHDPIGEESRVEVVAPLSPRGLFEHGWYQVSGHSSPIGNCLVAYSGTPTRFAQPFSCIYHWIMIHTPIESTDHRVTIDKDIPARPERVWELLTSDDGLSEWMGQDSSIEPWSDGRIKVSDPVTGIGRSGRVTEIDEGRSIRWVWSPDDPKHGPETTVHILVGPSPDGTTVQVTETVPALPPAATASRPATSQSPSGVAAAWAWRAATISVAASRVMA